MSTNFKETLREVAGKVSDLIRAHDGVLTRELVLQPGGFGLGMVPAREPTDATTTMVCGFCSTGCGLNIHLHQGQAVRLSPKTEYPVNLGIACPKGWEALEVLKAPNRATEPMMRNHSGNLVPVTWQDAMTEFVSRFKAIQLEHGAESIAWLGTGQIPTEELAFLGALGKFGMGMIHGDGNTRQCMATAATAYKQSFGFDAPPFTYADFEQSDVLVFVGANPCIAHPILWERVMRNQHDPEIVVIDPRTTETAMQATMHLAIQPKSDLALFYGLARILIQQGWIDREYIAAHTSDFEAFAEFVDAFTPESVAQKTGIDVPRLFHLARLIHEGERVSFWWTMGVNQSYEGTRTAQALINLALMTGNIGRPGTGANSITGQCNAMGSRIFSNTTNLLGGRDFEKQADREKVAETLGIPVEKIPDRHSLAYHEIIENILRGKIRGLWIIATNTSHSWINQKHVRDVLSRLDFLVVQDMYHDTETAQQAHLMLPAAGWGEKEGTFINSERRIGLLKKVVRAPGQALADFSIFRLIADAWGCGEMFREWTSPEAAFRILGRLSAGQPCDFSGIADYAQIDAAGGIQWPFPSQHADLATERRLFADGQYFHADGRAKFLFELPRKMPEPPSAQFPLILLTGRGTVAQWHTETRTKNSAVLKKLYPHELCVEIHPSDAERFGIGPHNWVVVASQRAEIRARAFITPSVQPGQVFLPMHNEVVNTLTHASFDPYSKQPSYKACAVSIRRDGA